MCFPIFVLQPCSIHLSVRLIECGRWGRVEARWQIKTQSNTLFISCQGKNLQSEPFKVASTVFNCLQTLQSVEIQIYLNSFPARNWQEWQWLINARQPSSFFYLPELVESNLNASSLLFCLYVFKLQLFLTGTSTARHWGGLPGWGSAGPAPSSCSGQTPGVASSPQYWPQHLWSEEEEEIEKWVSVQTWTGIIYYYMRSVLNLNVISHIYLWNGSNTSGNVH